MESNVMLKNGPGDDRPARIGVYVRHCGMNIAGTVDFGKVAEASAGLPSVTVAR
jgi:hypothetical protein